MKPVSAIMVKGCHLSGFIRYLGIISVTILFCGTTSAADYKPGDEAYLCLKRTLHPNWPEQFAIRVEVMQVMQKRIKVRIVDDYPMAGRTNEEETPVKGDVMKISIRRVYGREQAGVAPGDRFEGKPVCKKLMEYSD